jgi:rod shape determining protein RodA
MKRKYIILIPIIILISISLIYLPNSYKIKEFTWFIISLSTLIIINNFKFKTILKYSKLYYLISLFLLIGVLIIDKFTNGSRGWINIGPLSFQPSEFMKISLILLSIKYLNKIDNWLFILIYLIPIILIFLEPDTGAVIMLLIILTVFLFKKLNKRQILRLFAIILFISVLFIYIYLKMPNIIIKVLGTSMYYRIDRLTSFISNDNLQTTNALISISTGHTLYFPEMFNDFFIAYILSQNIYMIIPILISTIWILIWLIKKNTLISQIVFYLFLWQFWWNIAMNLNLVPVIGIPYLFLSYGGSHLLSSFILISLVMIKKDVDNNHNN